MADLSQQINDARTQGYADDEILSHLESAKQDLAPKIHEARTSGYQAAEILDHLRSAPVLTPAPAGARPPLPIAMDPNAYRNGGSEVLNTYATPPEINKGYLRLKKGQGLEEKAGGAADLMEGIGKASLPFLAGSMAAAPGAVIRGGLGAALGHFIGQHGASALHAGPEVSRAVGDVTSLGGGAAGASIKTPEMPAIPNLPSGMQEMLARGLINRVPVIGGILNKLIPKGAFSPAEEAAQRQWLPAPPVKWGPKPEEPAPITAPPPPIRWSPKPSKADQAAMDAVARSQNAPGAAAAASPTPESPATPTGPSAPHGSVVVPPVEGVPRRYGEVGSQFGSKMAESAFAKDQAISKYLKVNNISKQQFMAASDSQRSAWAKAANPKYKGVNPDRAKDIAELLLDEAVYSPFRIQPPPKP